MKESNSPLQPILNHLQRLPTNSITVVNGKVKKQRDGVFKDRYCFTMEDIRKELENPKFTNIYEGKATGTDIEALTTFIMALPNFGLGTGSTVNLKMRNGTTQKIVNRDPIELKFRSQEQGTTSIEKQTDMSTLENKVHEAVPVSPTESQLIGMAARFRAESKLESIQERYTDKVEQNASLKEDLGDARSRIRKLEEENLGLRSKLSIAEAEKGLAIKTIESEKRSVLDSDVAVKLVENLPSLASALVNLAGKNNGAAVSGMGASDPISENKRYFIDQIMDPEILDDDLKFLYEVLQAHLQNPDFMGQVRQLLTSMIKPIANHGTDG
ncbi:hypothetical protein ACFQ1M_09775 [Sungkyunkwania multivorans]|uniref:Uncharacterized protein n=1 Tax=Sungkyunkwania multivorans TaxID=1173618 RepID=A0ABW3CY78_9FLAO